MREIRAPLVGSTITPIVVFLPLISITGVTGVFFRALAITVGDGAADVARVGADVDADLEPLSSSASARERAAESGSEERTGPMAHAGPHLRSCATLRAGAPLVSGAVLRRADRGHRTSATTRSAPTCCRRWTKAVSFSITSCPAGSSLAETNRMLPTVEKILKDTPEVETTSRRTGLQLGLAAVTEANRGDFSVKLKRHRKPRHRRDDRRCAQAGQRASIRSWMWNSPQLLQDMIGDLTNAPEPIVIKMFSQYPDVLRQWAPQVADAIKKIPGVVDVLNGIENTISGPAVVFQVDPAVAARAGFTPQEVELDASAILQGEPAPTPVVLNDRAYTIRVRFPEATRASMETIRNTLLSSSHRQDGDPRHAREH